MGAASATQHGPRHDGGWIPALDNLRAVACLAVVGLHLLWETSRTAATPGERGGWLAASQLLLFAPPLFAFLAGFLCARRHPSDEPAERVWRRRLLALGPPYLAWAALYLLLDAPLFWQLPPGRALGAAALGLVFGPRHLGFLCALFQLYLLYPLLRKAEQRVGLVSLVVGSVLAGGAWLAWAPRLLPLDVSGHYSFHAAVFLAWLPYFAVGIWAAESGVDLGSVVPRPRWMYTLSLALLLLSAASVFGRSVSAMPLDTRIYAGAGRVPVMIACLAALPWLVRFGSLLQSSSLRSLLREVARYSLPIYLAHPLALRVAVWLWPSRWGGWPALVVFTLVTLVGTVWIVRTLLRHPAGVRLLGVRDRGRSRVRVPPSAAPAAPEARLSAGAER